MVCALLPRRNLVPIWGRVSRRNFSRVAVRGGGSINEIIDQKRGQTQLSLAGELLAKFRVPVARHTIHFMYDVSSLPGYSPGTTSAWTRDEGWTVTYANGTVIKREGDGWTAVTTEGSKSEEDEDD